MHVLAGLGQAVAGATATVVGGASPAVGGVASAAGGAVAGVGQGVAGVAGGVVGFGVSAVFAAASGWVASGAVWLLGEAGHALSSTTTVNLGTEWFSAHETVMAALAAAVVVPMVCCAALQAVYHQSASMLGRAFLVHLPLALLLTGVAVELVQMALTITDALSAQVMAGAGVDSGNLLAPVTVFLAQAGLPAPGVPGFVVFVGGILVAVGALGLWLELVVRAAAVTAATLFLPLTLAALVWPAVSHWCRRLADTLAALILSKLVIAAVLSLAVGALAGGLGAGGTGGDGGGFASVVTGVALLLVATLSPFTLLRLVPAIEAGAVAHVESTRHRLADAARMPGKARNFALDVAGEARPSGSGATPAPGDVGSAGASIGALSGVEPSDPTARTAFKEAVPSGATAAGGGDGVGHTEVGHAAGGRSSGPTDGDHVDGGDSAGRYGDGGYEDTGAGGRHPGDGTWNEDTDATTGTRSGAEKPPVGETRDR